MSKATSSPEEATAAASQILDALHDLTHAYRAHMRQALQEPNYGLTPNELRCLLYVGHHPLSTHKELMEHLHADKAQVARTLRDMEASHWIERVPHPEDRRSRRMQLSDSGQQLFRRLRAYRAEVGLKMLQDTSTDQQAQLLALLRQMRLHLENEVATDASMEAQPGCRTC